MKANYELIKTETIESLIFEIRGKQVILDSDVARLYGYEAKRINETVRRNAKRFPEGFCFPLTEEESKILRRNNLRSQIATSSLTEDNLSHGGRRYLPYVFTEQGIAMLSGLLKNEIAINISINIMNAFVEMRHFINGNKHLFERVIAKRKRLQTENIL